MAIYTRDGKLEVVVYVGREGGKRRSISRTVPGTGRAAQRAAKLKEGELLRQAATERAEAVNATVGQLLDRWLETAQIERSTAYQDRLSLDKHVRPALGAIPLRRLGPADLDRFYRKLERGDAKHKPLAPATVRRIHNRLSSAFDQAERWGWIAKGESPARWASPPSLPRVDPESPSTEAVLAVLEALDGAMRTFVWLVAATGLRRAAACALRRDDLELDIDEPLLRTRRSLGMADGAPYVKGTKTGARHSLALGPVAVDLLRSHLATQDTDAAPFGTTIPATGYLFSHHDDCAVPWRPDWPTKQLRAVIVDKKLARVTLRGLRHWMITEGIESGAPIDAVAGRASHARASTTLDVYKSHVPASDRKLALTLETLLHQMD